MSHNGVGDSDYMDSRKFMLSVLRARCICTRCPSASSSSSLRVVVVVPIVKCAVGGCEPPKGKRSEVELYTRQQQIRHNPTGAQQTQLITVLRNQIEAMPPYSSMLA
ncbi:hypothetical protein CLAFUW4_08014 [Fulvia fulva]|uniref:Uncharacterized protein n=1 Tax=Passalora fulva TaxID=5499 RepID=A0A9Q8LCR8_PASFU|nr:uncharacterized protein CLAFUR5_08135 [Fulvia fulva]KAK4629274.1 hypothetical protein CLAFUR4_08019 [Fulvia fulva]KAK4630572.1 hypothetical protein CLAFUR0_08015 [Fulvia fulva]UJO15011.1 hypothetical protein CLAFUR5_08135 [Fulvia fulva]WPV12976.1 hypothetical protein CLAFUW4_08014 [Fulvia fulva]WPV27097.1 hypothetical protein CLAFUW7_08014 [Fulvia fulva]